MVMDGDFNKEYQKIKIKSKRIKNEMENVEIEHQKLLQYIESFR